METEKTAKTVKVLNRLDSGVSYCLNDGVNFNKIKRVFAPREEKRILKDEIVMLRWAEGGEYMLKHILAVLDPKFVRDELEFDVEPEYFYTPEDIKKILLQGSEQEFLDMIDFGNDSVRTSITEIAVRENLNDIKKREIIKEKLDYDVTEALKLLEEVKEDVPEEKPLRRRASTPTVEGDAPKTEAGAADATANGTGRRVPLKKAEV